MDKIFDLYTNASEYKDEFPDLFGRSRFYNSGNKDIFNPVISNKLFSEGLRPFYPGGKKYAVCVSHDIDHLYIRQSSSRKLLNAGKKLLKGRPVQGFSDLGQLARPKVHRNYDLKKLIEINDRFNIRSSYYFLALQKGEEDFNYSLKDIEDQLNTVIAAKGEIGLHGGHKAYNNFEKLIKEKK